MSGHIELPPYSNTRLILGEAPYYIERGFRESHPYRRPEYLYIRIVIGTPQVHERQGIRVVARRSTWGDVAADEPCSPESPGMVCAGERGVRGD